MAGTKKGKNKNKKREKSNAQKSNPYSKGQDGQKPEASSRSNVGIEDQDLAQKIYEKIYDAYEEADDRLVIYLNYSDETVENALLCGGYIIGNSDIVTNIMWNCINYMEACQSDELPIFKNRDELIMYWVQTLESFASKVYPEDTPRSELLRHILACKSLDSSNDGLTSSSDITEFDAFLRKNIPMFENVALTWKRNGDPNTGCSSSNSVVSPKTNTIKKQLMDSKIDQNFSPSESLPKEFDVETRLLELLDTSDGGKDEMLEKSMNLLKILEGEVKEEEEWAERKEMEVKETENQYTIELNMLMHEKSEYEKLKNENKDYARVQIARMMNLSTEIESQHEKFHTILETINADECENKDLNAGIITGKINEEQLKSNLKKAMKKEKVKHRKLEIYTEQIGNLRQQILEEKQKTLQLSQQLQEVDESLNEVKLRLKQKREEKENAKNLVFQERRLLRIEKENGEERLAALQQALDNEENKLLEELKILNMRHLLSSEGPSSSSAANIPDHRCCKMCFRKEVCIIFMPCEHLVVCNDCGERTGDHCPHCQVQISQKYRVYGAGS